MPSTTTATSPRPPRPILRKKKSVTFHPSTKPSSPGAPPPLPSLSSLLEYADLAPHRHDNIYIHRGYRRETASHVTALGTIFTLHNETCNIWTHLLPLLLLVPGAAWFLTSGLDRLYPAHTSSDWYAFLAFFGGTGTMLLFSSLWHTFSCLASPNITKLWNGIDYAGICACIWGSFVASLHFGLPDDGEDWEGRDPGRSRRQRYNLMISVLAAICVALSVLPRFRTSNWRPFRAAMFVAMGLSAVFPVLHGVALVGWRKAEKQSSVSFVILQGVLYIIGAGLYAARIPEKLAPGKFDIFGASHQIFHTLVVAAATVHLIGLLRALGHSCRMR